LRPDFSNPQKNNSYYDLFEDYDLIEASFAQQYGIRLRQENDMSWNEFVTLLAGLNGHTPLRMVVSIRSEKDPKVIKNFTKEQKQIYNRWKFKQAKTVTREEYDKAMKQFDAMFKSMGQLNKKN
jgi:hypothetical protein